MSPEEDVSSPAPAWSVRYSQTYLDQLDTRAYRARRAEIERRIEVLLQEPYRAAGAERLRFQFRGLRSARVGGATRVIYRICEECRREREVAFNSLDCCELPDPPPARQLNIVCLSDHYDDMPGSFEFDS